jgi:plasmid stabilization system protein ParE
MKFKITYNPEVQTDLQSAVNWYNEQQPGLGKQFFSTAKKHLKSLEDSAMHYPIKYDDIHCMPIKKFPFMAHYRIDYKNKTVKVEAVFHTSRDPERWHQRTKQSLSTDSK